MSNFVNNEWIQLRKSVLEKDFSRMNSMQQEAVFLTEGPLLVLAGAGSGKTTVLVNRIANIVQYGSAYHSQWLSNEFTAEDAEACTRYIEKGESLSGSVRKKLAVYPCLPWKVMAITFTNKAAGELKERLCNMLGGSDGEEIWASTFHSSCARILRRDAEHLGYSSHFTIYDTDDSKRLITDCLKALEIPKEALIPKAVMSEISSAKDSLRTPDIYEKEAGDDFRLRMISRVYKLYQKRLRDADAMDFDDLIVNTVRLFKKSPDVLAYYQNRFRYIMVDEYQDTNHAQYEFIHLLAQGNSNLCVVGDDDQSIYKFRGATIENIMNFEKDYPGASVVRLEQNYRSTQNILDAANAVIENNSARKGKTLWTESGDGKKIRFHIAENELDEADNVAKIILDGVSSGRKFADYAILYRMNSQSMMFERMFAKQGIPHRILGGTRFYERQEIRDMIAYLSVINNPHDEMRLRRIIGRPKRGIGDRTVENVFAIVTETNETFFEVAARAKDFPALSRAAVRLQAFAETMHMLIDMSLDPAVSMYDLYMAIIDQIEYIPYLRSDDPERAEDRIENVRELSSNIRRYEEDNGDDATLSAFLEEISLLTDIDNYDAGADSTVLMTIHSAKGLEFPCVFLPGWEEGIFPGMSVIYNPAEVEEERRLAYVAITRAREELSIYSAQSRMIFGSTSYNRPSRFVEEIPDELVDATKAFEYNTRPSVMPSFGGRDSGTTHNPSDNSVGGFKKPVNVTKATTESFRVGDTVIHKTFGSGLVINATVMANDTLLEISFEKVGTKKLFANFARLTKG
jgi:Superfamily I DNA and RNA helicases